MKKIPLTQGQFAIVDDCDFEWLSQWKWHAVFDPRYAGGGKFRAVRKRRKADGPGPKEIQMSRAILEHHGLDPGEHTDHLDRNPLNNQLANLEGKTARQNHENRHRQSQFGVGVSKNPRCRTRPYKLRIYVADKRYHIGYFATAEDAQRVRAAFL